MPDPQFRKRDICFADAGRYCRSMDKRKERYKSKKRWFSVEDFKLQAVFLVCTWEVFLKSCTYLVLK